ncbi:MAG: chemotaxis protein CheV [Desulfobacterales bacterium]|nr:chemotaxis protein CheV [Desulfobacterales bacterium]
MSNFKEPEAYLKSGSNELKFLEYRIESLSLGINILKVSRILDRPKKLAKPGSIMHPSILGMFQDHGKIIPLINLGYILGLKDNDSGRRVIITEFFDEITGFLIDSAEQVYTIMWSQVKGAEDIMPNIENPYVLAIAKPDKNKNIYLLDYEKIVLELAPNLGDSGKISSEADGDFKGSGQIVLIAEDSTPVREMLQLELEERNLNVIATRDGEEAIKVFEENKNINIVVADVEMPKKDGLALLGHIRQHAERSKTPVLIYSSIGDIGMKERARLMDANAHITKLDVNELFINVKKLLGI